MGFRTGTWWFADTLCYSSADRSGEMRQSNRLGENSLNRVIEQWALSAFNSLDSSGSFNLSILQPLETETTMSWTQKKARQLLQFGKNLIEFIKSEQDNSARLKLGLLRFWRKRKSRAAEHGRVSAPLLRVALISMSSLLSTSLYEQSVLTDTKKLRRVYLCTYLWMLSSPGSWGAYILAPKCRLGCVSVPYIQLIHVLLMYVGLLYMLDRLCFFLLAVYSTANAKILTAIASAFSSEVYIIIFVSLFLDGCPSFHMWIFLQKMKGEGCGKGRRGKEILLFLTRRENNSLNCMAFIIYATWERNIEKEKQNLCYQGKSLSPPHPTPLSLVSVYEGVRRMPRICISRMQMAALPCTASFNRCSSPVIHSCEFGLWGPFPSHSSLGRDCKEGRGFQRMDLTWKWHPTSVLLLWGHSSEDAPRVAAASPVRTLQVATAKEEYFFLLFLAGEFLSHLQRIFPLWPGTHGRRWWGGRSAPPLHPPDWTELWTKRSALGSAREGSSVLWCVYVCVFLFFPSY